ncbi:ABC transporter ATP-binding protein [Candidatus Cryosericum terrychapinii]|uniref:ABC transporter ATP-binding protein n=1 Tax=Candidatus Cryosericum terrychapinii TaxID=2290919 RepID=A0A398D2T5_9BACT|nr:ABC transporter ATP-binding protein [Candidatus Cryosericum terrychapinii]RIE06527.1 ABC transporter ATP-binding protein [Candidatus Cryosericum terrychapinii]
MSDDTRKERPIATGGPGPMGGGPRGLRGVVEKPKDFRGTTRRLIQYLKPQTAKLMIVFALAIASTAFAVYGPKISGTAVNQLMNGFVAKSMVSGISKAQEQGVPQIQKVLQQMQSAEDAAVTQAQTAAKQGIDQQFSAKFPGVPLESIPGYAAALAAAQAKAADTARSTVEKSLLGVAKLTPAQFTAMQQFVALPLVSSITDNNKKADTVLTIINLGKLLPMTGQEKTINVSQTDLDRGIADIRENGGTIPLPAIGKTLLFLLLVYVLSALLTFVMQYIMSDVAQKTTYDMRKELDYKLAALPLRYYDMHSNGEILSRMTNDMDTISTTLQQGLTQVIVSVFQILGYIYMMLTISGKLTLVTLATLPLYIITTALIARKSQKFYRAQQLHLGRLSSHAEEMYTGHNVVKAFGHEQESIATFEAVNNDLYQAGWKAQFMSGVMFPLMNFISNLGYVFIAVLGGVYVTRNLLNLGDITAFIQYSRSFSMPIIQTASIANVIQSTMACAERVFTVLDEPEEKPDADDAIVIAEPRGAITFDHVAFSYRPTEPLIADMNLDVKQGDTVAIVGPTGAGKTTLVNLLMRFYDIQGGAITFDGVETRKMRRGSLRTMFGMVLQDTWLFNGTIRENIAYGRDDATEEEIVAAAKAAHADHFIRSLPEGYDTVLNEEASNISAGQKQLLTIARVVLTNPAVLILDEATSSVDTRTEVRIQKAMAQLMAGRTSFVIAHRLSTIRDAHHILVMNHGAIVEQGTHKELLAQHGFYADLYNSQFTGAAIT